MLRLPPWCCAGGGDFPFTAGWETAARRVRVSVGESSEISVVHGVCRGVVGHLPLSCTSRCPRPRLALLALWLCGNHQLQGKAGGSRAPLRSRHASEASGWNAAPSCAHISCTALGMLQPQLQTSPAPCRAGAQPGPSPVPGELRLPRLLPRAAAAGDCSQDVFQLPQS